jgi:hypothetical protein
MSPHEEKTRQPCDVVSDELDTGDAKAGYLQRVRSLAFVALLAGCSFQSGTPPAVAVDAGATDAVVAVDAAPDAAVIPPDARLCFGNLINICLTRLPPGPVTLSGASTLDTSMDSSCTQIVSQTGGPSLCVIAGTSVTVSGSLTATGARPLVLIGVDTVSVPGVLDASSARVTGRRGAGANPVGCPVMSVAGQFDTRGGGGGAGGSFGTGGGNGGDGDTNDNGQPNGIADGGNAAPPQPTPAALRGGCNGGRGGDSDNQVRGGAGGDGGGAIYLIAGTSMTIAGDVFASGAGGGAINDAAGIEQGGGGGGAGGMIVLDALTVDAPGRVVANGGAGGGGGGVGRGGTPGGDGTTMSWNLRANGGDPAEPGSGIGADGTAVDNTANLNGTSSAGGGGGAAGGLGVILVYGTLQNSTQISPAPVRR